MSSNLGIVAIVLHPMFWQMYINLTILSIMSGQCATLCAFTCEVVMSLNLGIGGVLATIVHPMLLLHWSFSLDKN